MLIAVLTARRDGWRTYVVSDGANARWQVTHRPARDDWHIQNRHGHPVSEFGRLGARIVRTCEEHFATLEN